MAPLLQLDISPEGALGRALHLRARREGLAAADLVREILRKALAPEIQELAGAAPLADLIQQTMNDRSIKS